MQNQAVPSKILIQKNHKNSVPGPWEIHGKLCKVDQLQKQCFIDYAVGAADRVDVLLVPTRFTSASVGFMHFGMGQRLTRVSHNMS